MSLAEAKGKRRITPQETAGSSSKRTTPRNPAHVCESRNTVFHGRSCRPPKSQGFPMSEAVPSSFIPLEGTPYDSFFPHPRRPDASRRGARFRVFLRPIGRNPARRPHRVQKLFGGHARRGRRQLRRLAQGEHGRGLRDRARGDAHDPLLHHARMAGRASERDGRRRGGQRDAPSRQPRREAYVPGRQSRRRARPHLVARHASARARGLSGHAPRPIRKPFGDASGKRSAGRLRRVWKRSLFRRTACGPAGPGLTREHFLHRRRRRQAHRPGVRRSPRTSRGRPPGRSDGHESGRHSPAEGKFRALS